MEILTHHVKERAILQLEGDFTNAARGEFRAAVDAAKRNGCRLLLIDLAGVSFIDSAGLGLLTLVYQAWWLESRRVALIRPKAQIREALATQRLDRLLPIYESESEALASWAPESGTAR